MRQPSSKSKQTNSQKSNPSQNLPVKHSNSNSNNNTSLPINASTPIARRRAPQLNSLARLSDQIFPYIYVWLDSKEARHHRRAEAEKERSRARAREPSLPRATMPRHTRGASSRCASFADATSPPASLRRTSFRLLSAACASQRPWQCAVCCMLRYRVDRLMLITWFAE